LLHKKRNTRQRIILLFQKDVFIFKAENKAMRSASIYPLSISALNNLFACLVVCMIKSLYNSDIQVITPPLINYMQKWLTSLIPQFVGCTHDHTHTLLLRKQFVRCCTTKYIFWLGKNKFDRLRPSAKFLLMVTEKGVFATYIQQHSNNLIQQLNMDKLFEEFKRYEIDNQNLTNISGGDKPPENGTNCDADPSRPTTTTGGQTTTDYDWYCDDVEESPAIT
jgi:hypothetical protein